MYTEVKCLRNIVACRCPILSTLLVSWACFFTAQVKYFGCFFLSSTHRGQGTSFRIWEWSDSVFGHNLMKWFQMGLEVV